MKNIATKSESDGDWASVADLMAGLMSIFLFIAILALDDKKFDEQEQEKVNNEPEIKSEAEVSTKTFLTDAHHDSLQEALLEEFKPDLEKWQAEILDDNTVRFRGPEILFESGETRISSWFKNMLDDFCPRYFSLLERHQIKDKIDEIRIEGHTSSAWQDAKTYDERYLKNAGLSQGRSFAVLEYCYMESGIDTDTGKEWLVTVLRANGLSFARPMLANNGAEDMDASRRVEFRVITKTEKKELTILVPKTISLDNEPENY